MRDTDADAQPLVAVLALLALARRDFTQADHLVSLCLKSQPNNLLVLMLSGRLYLQTRRAEQALKAYQQVLQLSPKFGVPSANGPRGGLDGAMRMALEQGVGMDPRVGLGLSFWLLGDTKKGTLAWKRAIALVRPSSHQFEVTSMLTMTFTARRIPRIEAHDSCWV